MIATWCRLARGTIEIASGDRDLFALVEDPRVRVPATVFNAVRNRPETL